MGYATEILTEVRRQVAPSPAALNEARRRRDRVLHYARHFRGAARTYRSGSIAHGTANTVRDADCGVVLNRIFYPRLGPDGQHEPPNGIVEGMRQHLRSSSLLEEYPEVRFRVQDRSIKVSFNSPTSDGFDPTVDLIVALIRKHQPGLWIPKNMQRSKPGWSASHPERHTELFLPDDPYLRRTRVWTTRLAKVWRDRYESEPIFSSFNLSAFAYYGLEQSKNVGEALAEYFDFAAADLVERLTPDPAGVSGGIKLMNGATKSQGVRRLERARDLARLAVDAETEDEARDVLAKLFPHHVAPPVNRATAHGLVAASRAGRGLGVGAGGLVVAPREAEIKRTRSYGEMQR